jgi:hypothetical protein
LLHIVSRNESVRNASLHQASRQPIIEVGSQDHRSLAGARESSQGLGEGALRTIKFSQTKYVHVQLPKGSLEGWNAMAQPGNEELEGEIRLSNFFYPASGISRGYLVGQGLDGSKESAFNIRG